MGKNDKNIREDEMWCPECGAPIKKGFFTCSNCRFKVRMTREINKKQDKQAGSGSRKKIEETAKGEASTAKSQGASNKKNPGDAYQENPLKKSGHPRYWNF